MPTLHVPEVPGIADTSMTARYPWWRILVLCLLLLLSVVIYLLLIGATPQSDEHIVPFLHVWMISFLPYFAACAFVLATKPVTGRWHQIEVGMILLGALILCVMLLPLPPDLSRDSWRYLWDAQVTLHGFSPYVYAPVDKALRPLIDNVLFPNSRFRTAPTIYPPGAQGIFLLSYVLAPANLFFLKGIFLVFDMVTCMALLVLLKRKGLDQRRVIIYAWCPLPIVEFAIQLTIFVLRVRNCLSMEAAVLLLFGVVLSISSHVFPWYTTTLLLWVPVLVGPLWTRVGLSGRSLAISAVWYFTTTSLLAYFFNPGPSNPVPDWTPYYRLVYTPVMIALGVAAIIGVVNRFRFQKGIALANRSINNVH